MKRFSVGLVALVLLFSSWKQQEKSTPNEPTVDSVLIQKYQEVPLGSIKPKGWLLNQLQIMKANSTGHLDETYWKIKNDNGWLGGKGDGWEETPYWLDGAVPLAYLLDDAALKAKVLKYINWTIDHQRPSGYFGPITKAERENKEVITPDNCQAGEDWWPKMVMLKIMKQYYSASKDVRAITFMTNYFNYQLKALKACPVGKWTEWSQSRGIENSLMAQWLYTVTKQQSLLELSKICADQSFAWSDWFEGRDWVINAATHQNNDNWMHRHGVNVAMGLKDPAVKYQLTHDPKYLKALQVGFKDLMTLHGLPYGMFSADEDLHGNDPGQGTELCAIVESMYSLEEIIAITGDNQYMDALERMTFNALPTQTTDDYNQKQYFQMANQVEVDRGVFNFSLPFDRGMNNVFGARSGYTCCLANMHQGWTKFAQNLWLKTPDKGLAALIYSPNQLKIKIGAENTEVIIDENTNYPFENQVNFLITIKKAVSFPMQFRVPGWCKEAIISINGKEYQRQNGGELITINRTWKNKDQITLTFPMETITSNWGRNSRAIERGPLVYALKLDENWKKNTDEVEGDYFSVSTKTDWNYGLTNLTIQKPDSTLKVNLVKPVTGSFIWNLAHAPIEITASAKKIPGWKLVNGVAVQPVSDRSGVYKGAVDSEVEKITLIPYGCTKVRIVAFPVVP